jgi:hypothetical protein
MDVVSLAVLFVIKSRVVKVLDVLDCMFHSSCSRVSRVLSMAVEPISKSAVHYLAGGYLRSGSPRSRGINGVQPLMRLSYVSRNPTYTCGPR